MKTRLMAAALTVGGMFGAALLLAADVPAKAPAKLPTAVVDTHELMEVFYERFYEDLKKEMASQPADKKGWSRIKHHGIEAAELANLLAIREVDDEALKTKWAGAARDSQQSGLDLAAAATAQDWVKTQAAYQNLVKNCNACHQATGSDHAPKLEP